MFDRAAPDVALTGGDACSCSGCGPNSGIQRAAALTTLVRSLSCLVSAAWCPRRVLRDAVQRRANAFDLACGAGGSNRGGVMPQLRSGAKWASKGIRHEFMTTPALIGRNNALD